MNYAEQKLLIQLKLSWENLDVKYLESFLDKNIIYESQWVFTPLKGKEKVIEYLQGKFKTIQREIDLNQITLNTETGFIPSMNMRPCIILSQTIGSELEKVTLLIEVKNSLISRIDICFIPSPEDVLINDFEN